MSDPSDPTDPYAWPSYGDDVEAAPEDVTLPLVAPAPPAPDLVAPAPPPPPSPASFAAPASYSAPAPPADGGYTIAPQYLGGGETNGIAVTSMVMGILGLVSLVLTPIIGFSIVGVIFSPLAIGFGLWGRGQIDRSPGVYGNRTMATVGFWLGLVGTVLAVLLVLVVIAFIGFLLAIFSDTGA